MNHPIYITGNGDYQRKVYKLRRMRQAFARHLIARAVWIVFAVTLGTGIAYWIITL